MIQMNSCEWRKGPLKDVNFGTVADGLISSVFGVIKKQLKFYLHSTQILPTLESKKKKCSLFCRRKRIRYL